MYYLKGTQEWRNWGCTAGVQVLLGNEPKLVPSKYILPICAIPNFQTFRRPGYVCDFKRFFYCFLFNLVFLHMIWTNFLVLKGQIISKRFFHGRGFFKKTNENTSHTSKNEFICSFFGRILGLTICFEINWPLDLFQNIWNIWEMLKK